MMDGRFKACDKWHPGKPSVLKKRLDEGRERLYCAACNSARGALFKKRGKRGYGAARIRPYGIIPLKWTPPEMVDRISP